MPADLDLYSIFCTVARCGSLSHAARELYVSQPAISQSMHRLEYMLGSTLFTRPSRGITLTSEGRMLYSYADKAIEHAPEKRGRNGFYPPFEKALRARQDEIRHRLGIGNRARHTEKESRKKCSEIAEEAEEIKLSAVFNAAGGFCENREKCFPLAAERREHADRPYEQRHGEIRQHIEKPMPQSREKSYLHIRVPTVILRSTCRTARRIHATIIAASRQKYAHEKPTDGRPASSEKP